MVSYKVATSSQEGCGYIMSHVQYATLTRGIVMMIPAQYTCPQSWTQEYYGYLMTNHNNYHHAMFEYIERPPRTVPGSAADTNGALFYHSKV